jgi:hypothetical protein
MLIQMTVKPERCCAIPHLRQNLQEEEKMLDMVELMHLLCCKTSHRLNLILHLHPDPINKT